MCPTRAGQACWLGKGRRFYPSNFFVGVPPVSWKWAEGAGRGVGDTEREVSTTKNGWEVWSRQPNRTALKHWTPGELDREILVDRAPGVYEKPPGTFGTGTPALVDRVGAGGPTSGVYRQSSRLGVSLDGTIDVPACRRKTFPQSDRAVDGDYNLAVIFPARDVEHDVPSLDIGEATGPCDLISELPKGIGAAHAVSGTWRKQERTHGATGGQRGRRNCSRTGDGRLTPILSDGSAGPASGSADSEWFRRIRLDLERKTQVQTMVQSHRVTFQIESNSGSAVCGAGRIQNREARSAREASKLERKFIPISSSPSADFHPPTVYSKDHSHYGFPLSIPKSSGSPLFQYVPPGSIAGRDKSDGEGCAGARRDMACGGV